MFCNKIEIDKLEYKTPTSNRSGGKVVHVSTVAGSSDYKDRIRFQMSEDDKTNRQTAIWGLSTPLPTQDNSRRTLELTIESPDLAAFLNKIDEQNVKTALEKSPEWFKKTLDENDIKHMYVRLVKPPSNESKEPKPTCRVKVKCGDYPTNIYVVQDTDPEGNLTYVRGSPDDLARGVKCVVICETVGLWFMSRQFGMSLTATEILVWPNRRSTGIDAFTLTSSTKLYQSVVPKGPPVGEDDYMIE